MKKRALNFWQLRLANQGRCNGCFAPVENWSPTDWACAAAGELGEACNLIKKLRRLDSSMSLQSLRNTPKKEVILKKLPSEIAGTIIYLDLLCIRLGIDLGEAVRKEYNKVSRRVGSSSRL